MNRPCRRPGCPAIVARGGTGYCPRHQVAGQQSAAEKVRTYDRFARDPLHVAFYRSREWAVLRKVVLTEQPVCGDCGRRFSHHVDHVIPLADAWARRLDRSNLRGLCAGCHSAKTGRERGTAKRATPDD